MEKIGLIAIFDTSQFNKGLRDYVSGVNEANDATKQGESNSFSFARALEVTVGNALLEVAKLAGQAASAIFDFGKDSIGIAAEFESSLAVLQTAASSTGMTMEELGNIAIAVGADSNILGASASGAAEAMTGLYKSGLDTGAVFGDLEGYLAGTAELGGALRASFDLAAATTLDVAQAADLGVVALSTFGSELQTSAEKSDFVNMAMDNLVKAADASVAEVEDLAQALVYAGPAAASAGMSIQDTNNALAIMSTMGIKGSMAGTGLRQALASLQSPTDKASDALKDLGVNLRDNEGNMLPMVDIIGNFNGALEGMSQAEEDAALNAIFTVNGLAAMRPLLKGGEEGWNAMAEATANAAGMQEQAALKSQTYAGQMEALEGQIETLQIQFGSALLPALTGFIEAIIPIIEQHGPMLNEVFTAVGTALATLVEGFFALTSGGFAEGIAGIGDVIGSVFGETAKQAFIGVAIFLRENLPQAVEFLKTVWGEGFGFIQGIIQSFLAFFQTIAPVIQPIIEQVKIFFQGLMDNAGLIWEGIKTIIQGALDFILSAVTVFISLWTGNWDTALQGIIDMTSAALVSSAM